MLSSRERVVRALNHEQTDRPPFDLGSTCNTSITKIAYQNLQKYLWHTVEAEPVFLSKDMQVVSVDEKLLQRLRIDTRGIQAYPPDKDKSIVLSDDSYKDEWGIIYKASRKDEEILYYNVDESPLLSFTSVHEIEGYNWPDPFDPGRTRGLKEKARVLKEKTDFALVGHMGDTSIFETCTLLRGMEQFLIDLIVDKRLAQTLLERVLEIQSVKISRYLDEVGEYLDVVGIGDDFAGQSGLLLSPNLFRTMIKPYLRSYCTLIKKKTSAKLLMHSCGAVQDLLGDLIEIGIDIINPVQVSARGMNPEYLKKKFGKTLSFWGGIDTQRMLPYGTPEEVKDEVVRIINILGDNGGYVLNSVHNIQADVPPQNIVAMYDAVSL